MRVLLPDSATALGIVSSDFEPLPPVRSEAALEARCRATDIDVASVETTVAAYGWSCAVLRGTRAGRAVIRAYFSFLEFGVLLEATADSIDDRERAWSVMREARPQWSDVASLWHIFER